MGSAAQGSYVGTRLAAELCMTQVTETRKKRGEGGERQRSYPRSICAR